MAAAILQNATACVKTATESDKEKIKTKLYDETHSGGVACADDTVTQRLPASFTLDGDDEAGQVIAVSRQRRQTRATHKRQNTRKAAARQSQISTSLPLQDTDVLQSQLLSAHTHTHTTN